MKKSMPLDRKYWLWVTKPEFYQDEDGNDSSILDPTSGEDSGGWWTCDPNTQQGDLALLWRTTPKKDIKYLIMAKKDACSLSGDNLAQKRGWDYGCEYTVLYKFENPITIQDIHNDPHLQDWTPYRGRFQRRSFKITSDFWTRINDHLSEKNPGYKKFLREVDRMPINKDILLEEQLEELLVNDLSILENFGYNLELYSDEDGPCGRQYICKGMGGRIDLLCYDKKNKQYVVVELKNVRAGRNTISQIQAYMGWVKKNLAGRKPVRGIVISRGYDIYFENAISIRKDIQQIDVGDLGFR